MLRRQLRTGDIDSRKKSLKRTTAHLYQAFPDIGFSGRWFAMHAIYSGVSFGLFRSGVMRRQLVAAVEIPFELSTELTSFYLTRALILVFFTYYQLPMIAVTVNSRHYGPTYLRRTPSYLTLAMACTVCDTLSDVDFDHVHRCTWRMPSRLGVLVLSSYLLAPLCRFMAARKPELVTRRCTALHTTGMSVIGC